MKRWLLLMLLLFSCGGWAACTISTVNASFGSVTSFALSGTGEVETTGTLVVACDAVLNVLTNDSVTLNYTAASVSGNSRANLKRTDDTSITDVIPTRLCGLSGCASMFSSGKEALMRLMASSSLSGMNSLYTYPLITT